MAHANRRHSGCGRDVRKLPRTFVPIDAPGQLSSLVVDFVQGVVPSR